MDLAERLRFAWPKKYPTQKAFGDAAGISKQHISGILSGKPVGRDNEAALAKALGMTRARLIDPDDDVFIAALEDPTAAEPEPDEGPIAQEHRGATSRSMPLDSFMRAGGLVDGSLAIDVIKRPSGKSGEVLKRRAW